MGHETRSCHLSLETLSNEHGFLFRSYGPWLKRDNDLSPPGIYERPPEYERPSEPDNREPEGDTQSSAPFPDMLEPRSSKSIADGYEQKRHVEGIGQNIDSGTSKTVLGMLVETKVAGGTSLRVGIAIDQHDHRLSTPPGTKPKGPPSPFPDQMIQQNPHTSNLPETQPPQGPHPNPYLPNPPIDSLTSQSASHPTQSP